MLGVMRSLEHNYTNYGDVLDKKCALPIPSNTTCHIYFSKPGFPLRRSDLSWPILSACVLLPRELFFGA